MNHTRPQTNINIKKKPHTNQTRQQTGTTTQLSYKKEKNTKKKPVPEQYQHAIGIRTSPSASSVQQFQ